MFGLTLSLRETDWGKPLSFIFFWLVPDEDSLPIVRLQDDWLGPQDPVSSDFEVAWHFWRHGNRSQILLNAVFQRGRTFMGAAILKS